MSGSYKVWSTENTRLRVGQVVSYCQKFSKQVVKQGPGVARWHGGPRLRITKELGCLRGRNTYIAEVVEHNNTEKTMKAKTTKDGTQYKPATRAELLAVLAKIATTNPVKARPALQLDSRAEGIIRNEIPPHVRATIIAEIHERARERCEGHMIVAAQAAKDAMLVEEPDDGDDEPEWC